MAQIRNIITSLVFSCNLDLNDVAMKSSLPIVHFGKFNALRLKHMDSFCQIHKNGKAFINGGKSEFESAYLVGFYHAVLQSVVPGIEISQQRVVNIVATYNHGKSVNLRAIVRGYRQLNSFQGHWMTFEPELFPAVKYRLEDLSVTINIFYTGKCVLLGCKSEEVLDLALVHLQRWLCQEAAP
jgi:transcription initiation factor TFIID TATA-box-binding protein